MINEPQRLQYLDAMGITPWVARYRLPNALATPVCEWPLEEESERPAPAQRLHALLDEVPVVSTPIPEVVEPSRSVRQGKAREMLEGRESLPDMAPDTALTSTETLREAAQTVQATEPQQALHFSIQATALAGRWLVLLAQSGSPDGTALRLLGNLLRAADIHLREPPTFQAFRWPMIEEFAVEAPLAEARDGLRAFIEGRRHSSGWNPEQVLLFGDDPQLAEVLGVSDNRSVLLDLPLWQGPTLAELGVDAAAKRALLPQLAQWREAWANAASQPTADVDPDGREH